MILVYNCALSLATSAEAAWSAAPQSETDRFTEWSQAQKTNVSVTRDTDRSRSRQATSGHVTPPPSRLEPPPQQLAVATSVDVLVGLDSPESANQLTTHPEHPIAPDVLEMWLSQAMVSKVAAQFKRDCCHFQVPDPGNVPSSVQYPTVCRGLCKNILDHADCLRLEAALFKKLAELCRPNTLAADVLLVLELVAIDFQDVMRPCQSLVCS